MGSGFVEKNMTILIVEPQPLLLTRHERANENVEEGEPGVNIRGVREQLSVYVTCVLMWQ